jgi:hypothetical protein
MVDISNLLSNDDDWSVLLSFLPSDWKVMAQSTGALLRSRNFTPDSLLRTLMIHLADGCSLRETSVRAKQGHIAEASDVALLKRLNASGEWFRRMSTELMLKWVAKPPDVLFGSEYRVRLIDGSTISEPGATGSSWRIHYSVQLSTLQCDEVYVTKPSVGESFERFQVAPGDLFVGDRGFGNRNSVRYVSERDGAVIVRINATNLPMLNEDGIGKFDLLGNLRTLQGTKTGDWNVTLSYADGHSIKGRVCALKKSKEAAEKAKLKAERESKKQGHTIKPETLEAAEYIFIFTTLPHRFSAATVLEAYRGRWQIEIAFKRLKSLLGLGHLRKMDLTGAKAWLHGKLFVAFLIEAMIACGDRFSPWGYPMPAPEVP